MRVLAAFVLLIDLVCAAPGFGQAGTLDPTFGSAGISITDINTEDGAMNLAIQADDRIVVAGFTNEEAPNYGIVLRYLPDGLPDPGFNGNGRVVIPVMDNAVEDVTVVNDSEIVACGTGSQHAFTLAKLRSNGTMETTFGDNGIVLVPFSGYNAVSIAITAQPDGRIVAAGWDQATMGSDLALFRCLPNGSPDPEFGNNGQVTLTIDSYTSILDVLVQPDGKILAGGYMTGMDNFSDGVIARFTPEGDPDTTFGINGVARFNPTNGIEEFYGLALQEDGGIVAVGFTDSIADYLVMRVGPDGTLDPSFGGDGIVFTNFINEAFDRSTAVMIQPDGRIVVSGTTQEPGGIGQRFSIARYDADGSLDNSFNGNGRNIIYSGAVNWGGTGIAMQSNGRLVAVGGRANGPQLPQDILLYGIRSDLSVGIDDPFSDTNVPFAYPNPTGDACSVHVSLTEPEHVTLRLVDAMGREQLPLLDLGILPAGELRLAVDVHSIANGAYVLLVQQGGLVTPVKVVIR